MTEDINSMLFDPLFKALWTLFKETWWLWLIVLIVWLFDNFYPILRDKFLRERKFLAIQSINNDRVILNNLRKLRPSEFEDYIADLYSKLGYETERVGRSHDGGIDVIAKKDGVTHYIQCKKFIVRKVGARDVRDFYGAVSSRLANGNSIFITTNYFTTEAKKFAKDNMIEPVDGYALLKLVKLAGNQQVEPPKEESPMICPRCGAELVLRNGKYGDFYGCSSYPKCRFIKKI